MAKKVKPGTKEFKERSKERLTKLKKGYPKKKLPISRATVTLEMKPGKPPKSRKVPKKPRKTLKDRLTYKPKKKK